MAPDGTYSKPPTDKITYGPLVQGRVKLVLVLGTVLSRTVTIAVRYSVVRRQGEMEPGYGNQGVFVFVMYRGRPIDLLYMLTVNLLHPQNTFQKMFKPFSKAGVTT